MTDINIDTLAADYPSLKSDDVRRFLLASKGITTKARHSLDATTAWRLKIKPETITQSMIMPALDMGCWRLMGMSESGHPVLWIQLTLWQPQRYDVETYTLHTVYWLEALAKLGERFIVVFDLVGWKLSHATEIRKIAALVDTLQKHYPERLQAALLLRAPLIFSAPWTVIKPLLHPITAAKVARTSASVSGCCFGFDRGGTISTLLPWPLVVMIRASASSAPKTFADTPLAVWYR